MKKVNPREVSRIYRHKRIRKKVIGSSQRPRLCVHRSLKNFQAQIIDDVSGKVLVGMSTLAKDVKGQLKNNGNKEAATKLGESFAELAKGKGISKVCFDRGGFLYHGRIKAFADGARKGGLEF